MQACSRLPRRTPTSGSSRASARPPSRPTSGCAGEEAVGQPPHALLGTSPARVAALRAALESEGHWVGELEHARRDGQRVFVETRMVLVRDGESAGLPGTYVVEACRDVTVR